MNYNIYYYGKTKARHSYLYNLFFNDFSQTTTSLRSKILALDDYQDAPQLWKLYNDSSSVMDEATRLHAKVSLNYYFNRPDEMLQCVDSLLTLYPEECTPEQKLAYCYA